LIDRYQKPFVSAVRSDCCDKKYPTGIPGHTPTVQLASAIGTQLHRRHVKPVTESCYLEISCWTSGTLLHRITGSWWRDIVDVCRV